MAETKTEEDLDITGMRRAVAQMGDDLPYVMSAGTVRRIADRLEANDRPLRKAYRFTDAKTARQAWLDDAENWDEFGSPRLDLPEWLYEKEERKDMNANDTMTINGEEWVRRTSMTSEPKAVNADGLTYVICRGYYCGVHAGYLKVHDGNHCTLVEARRLWSWKAKKGISLSAVALHGLADDVALPNELDEIWLGDVYEIIPCTETAAKTIQEAPVREQS